MQTPLAHSERTVGELVVEDYRRARIMRQVDMLAGELESHVTFEETDLFHRVRAGYPTVGDGLGRAEVEYVQVGDLMA